MLYNKINDVFDFDKNVIYINFFRKRYKLRNLMS